MSQPILQLLYRLWFHISRLRRGQFALLLTLMILTSFAEILSIGAVIPFLAILTDPDRIFTHTTAQPIIIAFGLTESKQLLLFLTIAFGMSSLLAGAMRLILLWVSNRLSFEAGADISISIYQRTLYQPFSVHASRNSSEIIDGITNKANSVIYNIISPTLTIISSSFMLAAILAAMLSIDPVIAVAAFVGFGSIYIGIISLTRNRLLSNSQIVARNSTHVIKNLQEGLGGIRDVLLNSSQDIYCNSYRVADQGLRLAQANNAFISFGPRYAIEALGMMLIAMLAYYLTLEADGISKAIPVLGALALGAQRLLPVLQLAYSSWASIKGGQESLQDILEMLDQPLPYYIDQPSDKPMSFKREIELNQITFRYNSNAPLILNKLSLRIPKGSRVGIIGPTGSGKSTLLDILMCLLMPSGGTLKIDDQIVDLNNQRSWQAHIAHVPQVIFLADSSILENIAFGVPKELIDFKRVQQAAHQAQIDRTIESWPEKYETFVGERGVRLSGGQRQRIGIARALYKKADVIFFDEATSSLDNDIEHAVMQAIDGLSKSLTILIIAHRLTTLKNCTHIIELDDGEIKFTGSYQDLTNKSSVNFCFNSEWNQS